MKPSRIREILSVLGALAWRGFGLFLFILGGSAGVGALATGNPFMGVLIAWGTLMIGIIGAIGYAIATTGHADNITVESAVNDAVKKVEQDRQK
jgi:hypothetical protein